MLKVLYLPLNSGANHQVGMYDAWREAKVNLKIFDFLNKSYELKNRDLLNKEFLSIVKDFQPDLIHMQLQMTGVFAPDVFIEARKLCKNKVIITNWTGDIRNLPSQEMAVIAPVVDYTLISSTGQIKDYEKIGCKNVKYWQIGYDPKFYFPKSLNQFKYDLVFTGNCYGANAFRDSQLRIHIVSQLKAKLKDKFGIFGSGYSGTFGKIHQVLPDQINNIYNDSLCILSVSHYNDVDHYFSDRLLVSLASGRPTISWKFPEYQTYFSDGVDILIANSIDEIFAKIDFCKNNLNKAKEIGEFGAKKVQAEHTYFSRVIELLKMVGLR